MTEAGSVEEKARQHLEVVRGLFEVTPVFGEDWWEHAANGVFDVDNIVLHEPGSLPYAGKYKGLRAFQGLTVTLMEYWSDLDLADFTFTSGGDLVTVSFQFKARSRSTGIEAAMPFVELWRFENGRVVEIRAFYWDTAEILRCLS